VHLPLGIAPRVFRALAKASSPSRHNPVTSLCEVLALRLEKEVIDLLSGRGLDARIMHFVMRLFFRGIYIPQMNKRTWVKLIAQNRKPIIKLVKQGVGKYREARKNRQVAALAPPT